jgi:putative FmdB family regulatory protein
MPIYEFLCREHGVKRELRAIADRDLPSKCHACDVVTVRLTSAPQHTFMTSTNREAWARNERSAHEPRRVQRSACGHSHPAGDACSDNTSSRQTPSIRKAVLVGDRGCSVTERYERVRTYKSDHLNSRRLRYGWRLTQSGHIVVDAQQRAAIFLMLEMRSEHASLQQICDRLSTMQCQPPRNNSWYCATVKKIIDKNFELLRLLPHVLAHLKVKHPNESSNDPSALASSERETYSKRPSEIVNLPLNMH